MQAGYSAARFVANDHWLIDPRGVRIMKYVTGAAECLDV
jgi:hypothetical protein